MKIHCANTPVNIFRLLACGASFHFSSLIFYNSTQTDSSTLETKTEFNAFPEYSFFPVGVSMVAFRKILGFSVLKMEP